MATFDFETGKAHIYLDGEDLESDVFVQGEVHRGMGSSVFCRFGERGLFRVRTIYWGILDAYNHTPQPATLVRTVKPKAKPCQVREHTRKRATPKRSMLQAMDILGQPSCQDIAC